MSAIGGLLGFNHRPIDVRILQMMLQVLKPYGKNSQSIWTSDGIGFARTISGPPTATRLAEAAAVDRDSGVAVMLDGRLDNRVEIAESIKIKKTQLLSMSDEQVVLQLFCKLGIEMIEQLRGDFALSIWEPRERRFWLARDVIGVRPLYWYQGFDCFAFASLPRALLSIPGVPRVLNKDAIHDHLCQLPLLDKSFFEGIKRLQPGQLLEVCGGRARCTRYFEFSECEKTYSDDERSYAEMLQDHLRTAVKRRIGDNALVATQLSSGLDSAAVTAVAAQQLKTQQRGLFALTAAPNLRHSVLVPNGYHGDEGPGARQLAEQFDNVTHQIIYSHEISLIDQIRDDIGTLGCPPASPFHMSWRKQIRIEAARRGCNVLLCADAGNVTISYGGWNYLAKLLGRGRWLRLWREARATSMVQHGRSGRSILLSALRPHVHQLRRQILRGPLLSEAEILSFAPISETLMATMNTVAKVNDHQRSLLQPPWNFGHGVRVDFFNRSDAGDYYLLDDLESVARSDPTADQDLVQFCLSVPEQVYWGSGETKKLFKNGFAGVISPEILYSKSKGYQAADWFYMVQNQLPSLRDALDLFQREGSAAEYVNFDQLHKILDDWSRWSQSDNLHGRPKRDLFFGGLTLAAFVWNNAT